MRVTVRFLLAVLVTFGPCLGLALVHAQQLPVGAEGKRVLAIDLSTSSEGKVYDRAPDSARRHTILEHLRTREGQLFNSADLAKDLEYLTKTSHLFRASDWRVEYDAKTETVRVRLILTQPLIRRIRVVAPQAGTWSEDGVRDFWRSRAKLDSAEGSEFGISRLDADVKALAASGAFLDVRSEYVYEAGGVDVLIRVIQNQPVAVIQFAGLNQTGYRSDLIGIVSGRKPAREIPNNPDAETLHLPKYFPAGAFDGSVVTDADPAAINGAVSLIEAFYRFNGYAFVSVRPRVIAVPQAFDTAKLMQEYGALSEDALKTVQGLVEDGYRGRVALLFEVFEGPRVLIGDVLFAGVEGAVSPGSDAFEARRIPSMLASIYGIYYDLFGTALNERRAVLRGMIRSKRGDPFVEGDCVRDAEVIQGYLRERGWLDARVSFSNIQWNGSRSRVNVTFQVAPGPVYAAGDLRVEYETRAPRVPQGVAQPQFDAPVVTWEDLADALNLKADLMTPEQAKARWGPDYFAGQHDPKAGKHLAAYTLQEAVPWDEYALNGEPGRFNGAADRVRALLAENGYSNIEIEFIRVESQSGTIETEWGQPLMARRVGIVLRIQQGYKSYVGNVTFRGNESTREDVLRREVGLFPGEVFNDNKLKRGSNRLRRSQWFEPGVPGQGVLDRTTPRLVRIGDDIIEFTDVDFEVIEGRTNSFNFAAGFNTNSGFTAQVDLTLRNFDISSLVSWIWGDPNFSFSGAGQQLALTVQPPLDRQSTYRLSFTEPWLFGYPVSGGISGEFVTDDRGDYTRSRAGVDPFVGWRALPDVVLSAGYSYSIVRLYDVAASAPDEIKRDVGTDRLSQVWTQIDWTTTNNPQFPTEGFSLTYRYSYTGGPLGGTLDFWRMYARGQYYLPVAQLDPARTMVLAFNLAAWWQDVHSHTKEIPFVERFQLGGNPITGRGVLRGFEFGGVGPSRRGQAIGGNFMVAAFTELRLPIFPSTLWAVGFIDAGILTPTLNTFDGKGITVSGGFGLRLLLPILPVPFALDFGFPIINQPGNREEVISINLGFGF